METTVIIEKYKQLRLCIKIMPFSFGFLYILSLLLYFVDTSFTLHNIIDTSIYYSPLIALFLYLCSCIIGLCVWHRVAIITPIVGQLIVLFNHILNYPIQEQIFNVGYVLTITCLTILSAIKVFKC